MMPTGLVIKVGGGACVWRRSPALESYACAGLLRIRCAGACCAYLHECWLRQVTFTSSQPATHHIGGRHRDQPSPACPRHQLPTRSSLTCQQGEKLPFGDSGVARGASTNGREPVQWRTWPLRMATAPAASCHSWNLVTGPRSPTRRCGSSNIFGSHQGQPTGSIRSWRFSLGQISNPASLAAPSFNNMLLLMLPQVQIDTT